jgi:hypothetical protein
MAPATFSLVGTQLTIDETALTLDSLDFVLTDASLALTTPYAGYDTIHLDSAAITASGGTLSLIPPASDPQEYGFAIGPVSLSGQLDASGSGAPIIDAPFLLTNPTASGSIFLSSGPGGRTLALDGISLGAFFVQRVGPPLVLKADFSFEGASSAVPEPGATLLYAGGLGLVGATLRRRIR